MSENKPSSASGDSTHLALARAYRPQVFADLLGQDGVRRIIENALRQQTLHHALLLSGPRGVGKTTTARLIARAVNCLDRREGIEPCGTCASCLSMAGRESLDIIEVDAASHTSVEGIRDIVDSVVYRPLSLPYRVYIIDEVHMLSRSAFNALLKTLEEPPPHLKFLFATTEPEKIPPTVLSRCMRLELRRVSVQVLGEHYRAIAEREGFSLDESAAEILARAAEGSVRDGLSLLDCAMSDAEGKKIEQARVRAMLLLSDSNALYDLLEPIVRSDAKAALRALDVLIGKGAQAEALLREILHKLHLLSRLKLDSQAAREETDQRRGGKLAESLSLPALGRLWQIALRAYEEMRLAPNPLAALDMTVLRLCSAAGMPLPEQALAQLARKAAAEEEAASLSSKTMREVNKLFPGSTIV